jgi:hypothetical protein
VFKGCHCVRNYFPLYFNHFCFICNQNIATVRDPKYIDVIYINERCTQLNKILLNMFSILPPIISPDPSSVQWEGLCFETKTQYRDTVNIGYTRHRTETNKEKHNTEILATLGTPDTGQRQTNKKTIQGYCQHWVHQNGLLNVVLSAYCKTQFILQEI